MWGSVETQAIEWPRLDTLVTQYIVTVDRLQQITIDSGKPLRLNRSDKPTLS
jgi:hypothetical protein